MISSAATVAGMLVAGGVFHVIQREDRAHKEAVERTEEAGVRGPVTVLERIPNYKHPSGNKYADNQWRVALPDGTVKTVNGADRDPHVGEQWTLMLHVRRYKNPRTGSESVHSWLMFDELQSSENQ